MKLPLNVPFILCALATTAHARDQSVIPRLVGAWQLSAACQNAPAKLNIAVADGDHVTINEKDYPVLDSPPLAPNLVVTRPFNFQFSDSNELVMELKGPDGIMGVCHYTRVPKTSQP